MRVVDLILVSNELSLLGVMAEALRSKLVWKSAFSKEWGQFGPKFRVQGLVAHQPFFVLSCKTVWMGVLYSVRSLAEVSFVLSQFTRLADGRMDGRTDLPSPMHCSAVNSSYTINVDVDDIVISTFGW